MTITLETQIEAKLLERARRDGQDPDVLANVAVKRFLETEAQEYQKSLEEIREALDSGPGKPMEQYLAEQRAKHGHSGDWPGRGAAKEVSPGVFVENEVSRTK